MPLTAGQRIRFFTAQVQMGLTDAQHQALGTKVLVVEGEFVDFKSSELKNEFKNMRAGVPGVPGIQGIPVIMDAEENVVHAAIPPVLAIPGIRAHLIPAKFASRLLLSSVAWHYYQDTGR